MNPDVISETQSMLRQLLDIEIQRKQADDHAKIRIAKMKEESAERDAKWNTTRAEYEAMQARLRAERSENAPKKEEELRVFREQLLHQIERQTQILQEIVGRLEQ